MGWDIETDVLVVGAGACGFAGALAAHEEGVQVAIVEKCQDVGGSTAMSMGSFPAAGTRFQKEAGIEDSPERMAADLLQASGPHDVPELTSLLAHESASLAHWLVDDMEVRIQLVTGYRHSGHSVFRLHAPASSKGQDLVADLRRAVLKRDIPVSLSSPVSSLVLDDDRAVIGAVVSGGRSGNYRIGAKKIVLATNGFGANPNLVAKFCPEIASAPYFGPEGSTGEAVLWGDELSAQFANMGGYLGYPALLPDYGLVMSWTVPEKGGIVVNSAGRRFADESMGYSAFARHVVAQGGKAWAIFDARIHDFTRNEGVFRELDDAGGFKQANSLEELVRLCRVPGDNLSEALEEYQTAASARRSDRFGRKEFGFSPLQPPFYTCEISACLLQSQGGLKVDELARPLRRDGTVIKNLFAGGGAAAGIAGHGGSGYSSGTGILNALGLGRIAGRGAAKEIREQR